MSTPDSKSLPAEMLAENRGAVGRALLTFLPTMLFCSVSWAGFTIDNASALEGNSGSTQFQFTVSLSTCPTGCSVAYTAQPSSAVDPSDYATSNGILNFAAQPGPQTQTIEITVSGDGMVELDETFNIKLSSASGATIDDSIGVGTILNDDSAIVGFGNDSRPERDPPFDRIFYPQLSLSAPVDHDVVVSWRTVDGTARTDFGLNSDYVLSGGDRTFSAGTTTSQTVSIPGREDEVVEADETFFVEITGVQAAGRDVQPGSDGTITIENDDFALISIEDFTRPEGDASSTVQVTLTMDHDVDVPITVLCSTADGSATVADGDFQTGCLVDLFSAFRNTSTARVTLSGDTKVELDETFLILLGNITPLFGGTRDVSLSDGEAVVTVENDDSAAIRIFDLAIDEGDAGSTQFEFQVALDRGVDTSIGLDFTTSDGTALVSDSDYLEVAGPLLLSGVANELGIVTVEVIGDETSEPDEQFQVVLSGLLAIGRDVSFGKATAVGTIHDDDSCTFEDLVTLADVTLLSPVAVSACVEVTVGPDVFVDAPNGALTIVAGRKISISHLEVQSGGTLSLIVDPQAVVP